MSDVPAFVFTETQYNSNDGRIVLRRAIVAGAEPEKWREFLGVTVVELPLGEGPDGKVMTKQHEIIFPFFGISTHVHKNPLKCVNECYKVYAAVETKAKQDTIEHYKARVREHLASSAKLEEAARAEGKSIVIPGASTAGERHLDKDGTEMPAPKAKRSIIIGG